MTVKWKPRREDTIAVCKQLRCMNIKEGDVARDYNKKIQTE